MSDDDNIETLYEESPSAEPSEEEMLSLLAKLKQEHQRINQEVDALTLTGVTDVLKLKRMKKVKLSIKDQIAYLENMLTPDIIA
ncbi:MAG: YdcH family protein [Maricaulaceae bacterium]